MKKVSHTHEVQKSILNPELSKAEKRKFFIVSCLSIVAFLVFWWFITDGIKLYKPSQLRSPVDVLKALIQKTYTKAPDNATLFQHIGESLYIVGMGFLFGALAGIPLGIAMAWNKTVDNIVTPVFNTIRYIPPIAWIPIMILILGIGRASKIAVIFFASFFSNVLNSYTGIKRTKDVHIWVARTFGASRKQLLWHVAIPSALPEIMTGIKAALAGSWGSVVAAELLAANRGLGYMIQNARTLGRPDLVLAGIICIALINFAINAVFELVEKLLVKGVQMR